MPKYLKYYKETLLLICRKDKVYMTFSILRIIINSIRPFPGMILIREITKMLTGNYNSKAYISTLIPLLLLVMTTEVFYSIINSIYTRRKNLFCMKLTADMTTKSMTMDYENISSKDILDKKEMALKVFENFDNIFDGIGSIISNLIISLTVIYIVASVDFIILAVSLLGIVLNGYFSHMNQSKQYTFNTKNTQIYRRLHYFYNMFSDFSFAKEIRVFKMADKFSPIIDSLTKDSFRMSKRYFKYSYINSFISVIASTVLSLSVYLFLGYKVLVKNTIDFSEFTFLSSAVYQFNTSIGSLVNSLVKYLNDAKYIEGYIGFMNLESRSDTVSKQHVDKTGKFELIFENVAFIYPGQEKYALKNINIKIENGDKLAVVGENGAGKTTFIKLLLRLYDPTEGRILLNGTNIKDIDYEEYTSLFSAVFQDFKLFAFSLKDNVAALETEHMCEESIIEVFKRVGLYGKISLLKNGLDTHLFRIFDNEGIELSGGEQQKLAIARALYKNAGIIILDEPTAALDPRAEYEIYKDFNDLTANKTAVYISHRLSSTRFCDIIAVFDNGSIIQYGTHDSLVKDEGKYKELFDMQAQFFVGEQCYET